MHTERLCEIQVSKQYTHQAFLKLKTDMQLHQAVQETVGYPVQELRHGKQCCFLHKTFWSLNIIYCPRIPETRGYIIGLFHYCMHRQLAFPNLIMQKLFEPANDNLGISKNYEELQSNTRGQIISPNNSIKLTMEQFKIGSSTLSFPS